MLLNITTTPTIPEVVLAPQPTQPEEPKPILKKGAALSRLAENILRDLPACTDPKISLFFPASQVDKELKKITDETKTTLKRPLGDCILIKTPERIYGMELKKKTVLGSGHFAKVFAASLYSSAGKVRAVIKIPKSDDFDAITFANADILREYENLHEIAAAGITGHKPPYALVKWIPVSIVNPKTGKSRTVPVAAEVLERYPYTALQLHTRETQEIFRSHVSLKKRKLICVKFLKLLVEFLEKGKFNGDMKLDNILIKNIESDDPEVVLCDWGSAWSEKLDLEETIRCINVCTEQKLSHDDLVEAHEFLHKIMAIPKGDPKGELKKYHPKIRKNLMSRDIFASGIAIYEFLSGISPFEYEYDPKKPRPISNKAHYYGPEFRQILHDLDPEEFNTKSTTSLIIIMERMLIRKPGERLTLAEIKDQVKRMSQGTHQQ